MSALLLEYLGTSGGCKSVCKSPTVRNTADIAYERSDKPKLQKPNQYLFSVAAVELLLGISANSESIPNGYGFAIDALNILAYGAIGGLMIGCLMVVIERGVQKWSEDRRNIRKIKGLPVQLSQEPKMTEVITVELCKLIKEERKIDDIKYIRSYEKAREEELEKLIQTLENLTRRFELYTQKLINNWDSLSGKDRKVLEKQIIKAIKQEAKESDQIRVPTFNWLIKNLKLQISDSFLTKEHKQKINDLSAKVKNSKHNLEQVRRRLFKVVLELAKKDYYATLPEKEILERLNLSEDLDGENWIVSVEQNVEIDIKKIKGMLESRGHKIQLPSQKASES